MEIRHLGLLMLALLAAVAGAGSGRAESGHKTWNFDTDKAAEPPRGFTVVSGEWNVVGELRAPTFPNVLAQLARNSGNRFNIILANDTRYQDLDLSVQMRAVVGREDQGGGLVWRARDGRNYYVARYNPLEKNYNLYKVVQGRRTQLQSVAVKASSAWHSMRITMNGDRILGYLDNSQYLDTRDATFAGPGSIGLWTKADARTHFDDLTVIGE